MGVKGLIRDIIMFYVGVELVFFKADPLIMGWILIFVSIIFTIIAWMIFFNAR